MTFRLSVNTLLGLMDACVANSVALHGAAKQGLQGDRSGLASALSVLALEETGKVILVDGLLHARQGSERAKRFDRGKGQHNLKLDYLNAYPLFLSYLSLLHPDADKQSFIQTIQQFILRAQKTRGELARVLGREPDAALFNHIKQAGLYVGLTPEGAVESPAGANKPTAEALEQFAFCIVDPLRFIWKGVRIPYESFAAKLRSAPTKSMTDMQRVAEQVVEEIFAVPDDIPSDDQ